MIKGILIFESGEVQVIGDLSNATAIIASLKQLIPQLETAERNRIMQSFSAEDLEKMIFDKKAEKGKTPEGVLVEKLEP